MPQGAPPESACPSRVNRSLRSWARPPDTVIFTSGGTEANNQALRTDGKVAVSAIEHPSVLALADEGCLAPVDANGVINLQALQDLLKRQHPATLAVMLANNETGVVQPVKDVAAIAHEAGVRLHVDAIQAAGKIPVDFNDLGADTLSLSAHKIGGPQGVGALIARAGFEPPPLLKGGAQETRNRAGTENLPGIVGFGEAAALALNDDGFSDRIGALRDQVEASILEVSPDVQIAGARARRLPNTSCLVSPGLSHETQLIHFDLAGIAVSAGSACSSGKIGSEPGLDGDGHVGTRCGIGHSGEFRLEQQGPRRRSFHKRLPRIKSKTRPLKEPRSA